MADVLRVRNPQTGCKLKLQKAKRMHEQCMIKLDMQTMTYRNCSLAEMIHGRAEIAKQQELQQTILGMTAEIPGLRFINANTEYCAPREAYEEMESPLGLRTCRWPRLNPAEANQFAHATLS